MKKKKILFSAILLIAIFSVGAIAYNTYARYKSEIQGSGTVTAAKWEIEVNDNDAVTESEFANSLTVQLNDSTLVAAGKIAPGRSGYFDLVIDPTNTEVAFDYTVEISEMTGAPEGLEISGYALSTDSGVTYGTAQTITGGTFTDTVELESDVNGSKIALDADDKVYARVYVTWENDEANNSTDTAAEGTSITVPVKVTLSQKLN